MVSAAVPTTITGILGRAEFTASRPTSVVSRASNGSNDIANYGLRENAFLPDDTPRNGVEIASQRGRVAPVHPAHAGSGDYLRAYLLMSR